MDKFWLSHRRTVKSKGKEPESDSYRVSTNDQTEEVSTEVPGVYVITYVEGGLDSPNTRDFPTPEEGRPTERCKRDVVTVVNGINGKSIPELNVVPPFLHNFSLKGTVGFKNLYSKRYKIFGEE